MDISELIKVITDAADPNTRIDPKQVMEAYHRLDDLGEYYLGELIDNYILGKLDSHRIQILEQHLQSCERCRKELATMRTFIKGVKDLGGDLQ